jgi:hypothetical protein
MAWNAYLNVRNGREPAVITNQDLKRPYISIFEFKGDPDLDQIEDLEAEMYKNGFHEIIFDESARDELKKLDLDQLKTIKISKISQ